MTLILLTNDVGYAATVQGWQNARNVIATGYDMKDLIAGPRNRLVRSMQGSGSNIGIFSPRYACDPAQVAVNYAVIARADYLTRRTNGCQIYFTRYGSTSFGGYAYESVVSNATLSAGLTGVRSQDYVYTYSTTRTAYGFGVESYTSTVTGANVGQCGQVFFSTGFDFGKNPDLVVPLEDLVDAQRLFVPPQAQIDGFAYDTEKRFTLNFRGVTRAKVDAFRALPNIQRWPLFLYDSAAEVFAHKLEHVLVETWTEQRAASGKWDISIVFRRLAHYD